MKKLKKYEGGCLCGAVRFVAEAPPEFPHLCSCKMCQKWSGAPSVAWVEFPLASFRWTGVEPRYFRSSEKTQRGNCPVCGSAICAVDDGYENISIVVGALDRPNMVVPDERHSYKSSKPRWWCPEVSTDKKPSS